MNETKVEITEVEYNALIIQVKVAKSTLSFLAENADLLASHEANRALKTLDIIESAYKKK